MFAVAVHARKQVVSLWSISMPVDFVLFWLVKQTSAFLGKSMSKSMVLILEAKKKSNAEFDHIAAPNLQHTVWMQDHALTQNRIYGNTQLNTHLLRYSQSYMHTHTHSHTNTTLVVIFTSCPNLCFAASRWLHDNLMQTPMGTVQITPVPWV